MDAVFGLGKLAAMESASLFADPGMQFQFERQGYCVASVFTENDLRSLEAAYRSAPDSEAHGFHATMYSSSVAYRREVFDVIGRLAAERLSRIVRSFEIVVANWLVKEAACSESSVGLHQDWSFLDERVHQSIHVWIPLVDVDPVNGCLEVVGGSHRVSRDHRAHADKCRFQALEPVLRADYAKAVPLKAGAAIFYDGALLHWSGPNVSGAPRKAIGLVLSPDRAGVVHCHRVTPDSVEVYAVSREFFWRHPPGSRPLGATLLGVASAPTDQHDAGVLALLERATSGRRVS